MTTIQHQTPYRHRQSHCQVQIEASGTAVDSGDKLMTPKPTAISAIQRNLGSAIRESPS
ncbi:hypothetical protein [Oscillatoria salina]|uniref:hypothetical protein n=1 Tax=Oscillatoria salina TaxID=331517 RepID=UPI001CC9F77C|nr:hypothetical protein [Oscillatoria salina]